MLREEGLSVDVASGGELHMALRAGFAPERIHMHGNNKTEAELRRAVEAEVGHVICDSLAEIEPPGRDLRRGRAPPARADPGHARGQGRHPHLRPDRPAGLEVRPRARRRARRARPSRRSAASDNLELVGLHAHIGSQIFELEPYVRAIEALGELADAEWCRLLNVGGGLGIAYTAADDPPSIADYVDVKVGGVERVFDPVPRILVEPGRSLVGNAGITAYTVGTVKEVPGVRTYVAVDGGMSDNMRPMLYGAALRGDRRRPRRRARRHAP